MRQIVITIVVWVALNLLLPNLWERFMSTAPAWALNVVLFVFSIGCIAAVLFAQPIYEGLRHPSGHPLTSTLIVSVASAFLAGSMWWFFIVPQRAEAKGSSSPTVQLYLECWPTVLPTTVPPNTQLSVAFAMQDRDVIAFILVPMPSVQGQITWNGRTDPRSMLGGVCKLTNYSSSVLFDVDLLISTEFHEVSRLGPDAFAPGKVVAKHDWTIRVPKIEASRQEPFVFYIANETQAYVTVDVRDALSATMAGRSGRRKVQLIRMSGGMESKGLDLTPKDFTRIP